MERADKIKFLQDLQSGKFTVEDLGQKELTVMLGYGGGPIYLINDKIVTESEFKEAETRQPFENIELGYGPWKD